MINGADSAWLMVSTVLVLLMTLPALGFFYAGLVQAKNVLSVFIQCVALAAMVSLLWFAMAYSLAFSGGGDWIGRSGRGVSRQSDARLPFIPAPMCRRVSSSCSR